MLFVAISRDSDKYIWSRNTMTTIFCLSSNYEPILS